MRTIMTTYTPLRTISVLLVEDNDADAHLLSTVMRETRSSIQINRAIYGNEALNLLRQPGSAPDVIFLDLNLPDRNGSEVLVTLKKDKTLCRIPVVILSSSRSEVDVNTAYDCGASLYLTKPRDLEELNELVETFDRLFFRFALLPTRFGKSRSDTLKASGS